MTTLRARRAPQDDELVRRTAAGDPTVARMLDARYRRQLTRYARSLMGRSEHDAEDVVQDVLVKADGELAAGRGPDHLGPWLYRLTRNRAIDEIRRARWGDQSLDAQIDGGSDLGLARGAPGHRAADDPADVLHRRESMRSLVRDLADLPRSQRDALLTRVVDGASPQESAERLGVSVEAVQMLVVRARANLARLRDLRQATGDVNTQLRSLAPPAGIFPIVGLIKLFGFGAPKVVAVVVAAVAVVAAAGGLEVLHTQHAGAGDAAPFTLHASSHADEYFDHSVKRGQPIPPGNAVVAATVRIAAGSEHTAGRIAKLQCPNGFRYADLLNSDHLGKPSPVDFEVVGLKSVARADGTVAIKFKSTVLAQPATVRLRVLCRKPGVGGNLALHPRVPKHGEGSGYPCAYASMFLHPYKTIVATLERGSYVTVLRTSGHTAFIAAPFNLRGWIKTSQLCRGWTRPTVVPTGPALFPTSELGFIHAKNNDFRPASEIRFYPVPPSGKKAAKK